MQTKPPRRCLDCNRLTTAGSVCPDCRRRRKKIRNEDRPIAQAVIASSPRCSCRNPKCFHPNGICGATTDLTADHELPLALGGTNNGKRSTFCRRCNSRKRDRA